MSVFEYIVIGLLGGITGILWQISFTLVCIKQAEGK